MTYTEFYISFGIAITIAIIITIAYIVYDCSLRGN